ncbi:MAG: hypothetical protein C0591_01440 [Marinilabiliales bacterium]|jgi:hypothetical protein|nr:MAG: hypothetical protein C0591_01440 [Marinilabiliales bacterium]
MKRLENKVMLLVSLVFINLSIYAGGDFPVIGSRQAGMGRSSVALTDFWNLQNNQAGVALLDKFGAGIYYESQFSMNQLSTKSAAFLAPTKIGVLGLTFNYFGYSLYNDMKIGLVYARSFGQYLRVGLQLDYIQTTLGDDYGSKGNVTFEIGLQSDITENITLGAWVYNPIQVKIADYDNEKIPAIFRFGIAWEITKGFIATVETEKNTNIQPIVIRGGLEYGLKEKFFFRGGFSTQEEILSMGFGFNLKPVRFDISAVMHESLGFSPQASLIFQF